MHLLTCIVCNRGFGEYQGVLEDVCYTLSVERTVIKCEIAVKSELINGVEIGPPGWKLFYKNERPGYKKRQSCFDSSGTIRTGMDTAVSGMLSDEDSSTLDPFELQRLNQEQLQKKLYFLIEHLKSFHSNLPE